MNSILATDKTTKANANPAPVPQRLILAGGGHAHLAVLASFIRQPPSGLQTCLITAAPFTTYSGMIPGWMAGHYSTSDCQIDLRPLARHAGVTLIIEPVCGLDAQRQHIRLANGQSHAFDLLSLAIGGEVDTSHLALLGERMLSVRPMDGFLARWPDVVANARLANAYHLVVVGGGAAGVELALGAAQALRCAAPHAAVTLVAEAQGLVPGHGGAILGRVRLALAQAGVEVMHGHAAGTTTGILLDDGTHITANCVIAATGSKAPDWLRRSGLALDNEGFIAVGADLRSVSHENIFAAGDIITRIDRPVARSGVHAVKGGQVLATNLRAALTRRPLVSYIPGNRTLYLLATGEKRAILSWGGLTMAGKLWWYLKDWIDRRYVALYTKLR